MLVALAVAGFPAPANASPALETVRVGLMSLEAPAGLGAELRTLAVESERILPRVESVLGVGATARFRMLLIPAGAVRDSELRHLDSEAPWWAAGFTIPSQRICAIRMALAGRYPYGSLEAVLAHEATHLILHDAVGDRLPLWFEEGVATWTGRRWEFRDVLAFSSSLLTADVPRFATIDESFRSSAAEAQLAYAAAHAFVASAVHSHGPHVVPALIRECRTRSFESAWERVTGTTLAAAERDWRRTSLIRYRWLPLIGASSTLWVAITLLSIVVGVRKRAQAAKLRQRWAREEREEDAPMSIDEPWLDATTSNVAERDDERQPPP